MSRPAKKRFLWVSRHAPHGSIRAQEGLDALLMAVAFEQPVSVVFLDDGVYQLKRDQRPDRVGLKNFCAGFPSLAVYDVHDVYAERESLALRGLAAEDLLMPVRVVDAARIGALMDEHDVVMSF